MKIHNYKQINKGSLKAYFDLEIPKWGVKIRGMSLIQTPDKKRFVSFPTRSYDGDDGKKKYVPYIELLDRSHRDPFIRKVLEAIDKENGVLQQESIFPEEEF